MRLPKLKRVSVCESCRCPRAGEPTQEVRELLLAKGVTSRDQRVVTFKAGPVASKSRSMKNKLRGIDWCGASVAVGLVLRCSSWAHLCISQACGEGGISGRIRARQLG